MGSAEQTTGEVEVSCPGKVLVAGGYAILERPNRGLVLATTARFHTLSGWGQTEASAEDDTAGALVVEVASPQYGQLAVLRASLEEGGRVRLQRESGEENKYVEHTLAFALAAAERLAQTRAGGVGLHELLRLESLEQRSFSEVLETLDTHIEFAPAAFSVGDVHNSASENQKSAHVLAFAKRFGLDRETTLRLWGEHFKAVTADPEGASHGNLRGFMAGGWEAVRFESEPIVALSQGAQHLLREGLEAAAPAAPGPFAAAAGRRLCLTVRADNDFYSQQAHLKARGMAYTTEGLKALPAFLPCRDAEGHGEVAKTGLGSSAAMVTSLVACVCRTLVPDLPVSGGIVETLHAVAQLAHNMIQGKIGSGFDVCAAAYGSMKYVRYDSACLAEVMAEAKALADASDARGGIVVPSGKAILACRQLLNHSTEPFQLPPRIQLLCGDVCGGSETPSMSRKILAWKKAAPEEELAVWARLLECNEAAAAGLEALRATSAQEPAAYAAALDHAAAHGFDQPCDGPGATVQAQLQEVRQVFADMRGCLKKIGDFAGVPVEPPCQTALCDETAALPGVLACGVPGAGGFDAVFALVVDSSSGGVEQFWGARRPDPVCALLLSESHEHPGIAFGPTTSAR